MEEKPRRVLDEVRRCRGRSQAMTARQLARVTGIREREVRSIIADLRRQGYAIGSAVNPPYGYFMPATVDEARELPSTPILPHAGDWDHGKSIRTGIWARSARSTDVLDLFNEAEAQ